MIPIFEPYFSGNEKKYLMDCIDSTWISSQGEYIVKLEKELAEGNLDNKKIAEKSKEYSDLNEVVKEAREYASYESEKNDLEKIINDKKNDKEIKELANLELIDLNKKNNLNEKKIKIFLLPKDDADNKNAIIEI